MNEDFSDIISKFSTILKEKDIDLNNIVGGQKQPPTDSHAQNYDSNEDFCNQENDSNNSSNDFNLDIETIYFKP